MALRGLTQRPAMLIASALVMVAAVACDGGDSGTPEPISTNGGLNYRAIRGSVDVDGSSTVFPISEAVAEEFMAASRARVNVGFSGTGGGFQKFCRGETQVTSASRPIKQSELDACAAAGVNDVIEIQVAIDALTVMVNPNNTWAECMTVEELNLAFRNGGAQTWADIRPEWPAERILTYYPGTDSGTFDYFNEAIIGAVPDSSHRGDGTASEDDNILVVGIENDRYSIGYFGFAYFLEAGQALKPVQVDGGDGCVEPTFEAALEGSYTPLSRPLLIYTRESLLRDRPEVLGFVNFYVENTQELAREVGYISMPEDVYQAQVAKVSPFLP